MLNSTAKVQSFQNRYSKLDETIRGATVIISIWLQVSANLLPLPWPAWSLLPVEGFCKSSLVTITDYIAFQPGSGQPDWATSFISQQQTLHPRNN